MTRELSRGWRRRFRTPSIVLGAALVLSTSPLFATPGCRSRADRPGSPMALRRDERLCRGRRHGQRPHRRGVGRHIRLRQVGQRVVVPEPGRPGHRSRFTRPRERPLHDHDVGQVRRLPWRGQGPPGEGRVRMRRVLVRHHDGSHRRPGRRGVRWPLRSVAHNGHRADRPVGRPVALRVSGELRLQHGGLERVDPRGEAPQYWPGIGYGLADDTLSIGGPPAACATGGDFTGRIDDVRYYPTTLPDLSGSVPPVPTTITIDPLPATTTVCTAPQVRAVVAPPPRVGGIVTWTVDHGDGPINAGPSSPIC